MKKLKDILSNYIYLFVSTFRLTFWCSRHVIYEGVKLLNLYTEENIFFGKI